MCSSPGGSGLVLFLIDACRDPADAPITKGLGSKDKLENPAETRFVRLFGCKSGEVCQILPVQPSVSLFSKALAESISASERLSLKDLLDEVRKRSASLAGTYSLLAQTPTLSLGDIEDAKVLNYPIVERTSNTLVTAASPMGTVWAEFDPNCLHCLVVASEFEATNRISLPLSNLVEELILRPDVWNDFKSYYGGKRLVTGQTRQPGDWEAANIRFARFSVLDCLEDWDSLDQAVRAVIQADIVVFDITGFEPSIMLLAGIRSAARAGLSICSHGGEYIEGAFLKVPFNIQNLSFGSHAEAKHFAGTNWVLERLEDRIRLGFRQLRLQKNYIDLPAYAELRHLGSDYEASSTIDAKDRILCLCSFDEKQFELWRDMQSGLKNALRRDHKIESPTVERVIDYGSPQLVSQTIYEHLRRCAGCVVDWTRASASVFFELGVRLAVSEWGAVHIVRDICPTDGSKAKKLVQFEKLRSLFRPFSYAAGKGADVVSGQIAELLLKRNPNIDVDPGYNRIHRAACAALERVQECREDIDRELDEESDALHHTEQGRFGAPQILFHRSALLKHDSEDAALERRIAAWLYMHYRLKTRRNFEKADWERYRKPGHAAIDGLYDHGYEAHFELAELIEKNIKE